MESNGQPGIMVAHSVSIVPCCYTLGSVFVSNPYLLILITRKMGNNVFRYFLEWLRVQMREEAYERFVEHAELTTSVQPTTRAVGWGPILWRRRTFRLANNAEVDADMLGTAENEIPGDSSLHDFAGLFEVKEHPAPLSLQQNNDGEETGLDESTYRKFPQLYELAKVEGDMNWIAWLDKHIWTYVGLAAPLLGAPGPLRSVLSGENMGLPFTHEE